MGTALSKSFEDARGDSASAKRPRPRSDMESMDDISRGWNTHNKHRFDVDVLGSKPDRPRAESKSGAKQAIQEDCSWYDIPCWFFQVLNDIIVYETECVKEVWNYVIGKIKYAVGLQETPPLAPSGDCWVSGGIPLLVLGAVIGIILYYGQSAIQFLAGILKMPINAIKSLFSADVDIAQYVQLAISNVTYFFRQFFGWYFDTTNYLSEITNSSEKIWILVSLTAFAYLASQLGIELVGADVAWHGTIFYEVFKVIDYPFEWLSGEVKDALGDGILYWLFRVIEFPFQLGMMVISFVMGGIVYVVKEIWENLTENAGDN